MRILIVLLVVVVVTVFVFRRRTSYTLGVNIEPEDAATISEIDYKRGNAGIIAEFTLDIKDGYVLKKWTGTLPRLEGYDPARWYDPKKNKVSLEIDHNESITIHFDPPKP